MYKDFFQLSESPFSIVPNPKFYYLSEPHKEALMHVLNDIEDGGGLTLLTGEVGTGKTTTLRELMARLPKDTQVITLLNPSVTVLELMTTLCKEMGLKYRAGDTFKTLYDVIASQLFLNEEKGIKTILLVDEAQHVSPDVLEQLRLLTNIENTERKLLKVILIAQPELQQILRQPCLRQLAQRITVRYHLHPLSTNEVKNYILHRLNVATRLEPLFSEAAINVIAMETSGVPRLINLVCDQALKLTYKESKQRVSRNAALTACRDVLDWQKRVQSGNKKRFILIYIFCALLILSIAVYFSWGGDEEDHALDVRALDDRALKGEVDAPTKTEPLDPEFSSPSSKIESQLKLENKILPVELKDLAPVGLARLITKGRSFGRATEGLYQQWGFKVEGFDSVCSREVRGDMVCNKITPTFSSLLAMRRPAVLEFKGPQNQSWYGVLLGSSNNGESLEVKVGKLRVLMSRGFFEKAWTGDTYALWLPLLGSAAPIKMGQRGSRVAWLNDRLDKALSIPKSTYAQFGIKLRQKVISFQGLSGLEPDGIPGPMTLMMLEAVIFMQGPTLKEGFQLSPNQEASLLKGEILLLSDNDTPNVALIPLPEKGVKGTQKRVYAAFNKSENKNLKEEKEEDAFLLSDVDLSQLSPQLLKRVQVAFAKDKAEIVKDQLASIDAFSPNIIPNNAIQISTVSAQLLARLPPLDFQAHIYASSSSGRWVKVNGKEVKEGEFAAPGVLLRGIEHEQVVVEFEEQLLAIPAMTSW